MAEKERRMKKKRQQKEMQQQLALQEPFYVRANPGITPNTTHNNLHSPIREDSMSEGDNESKTSMHGLSILAPRNMTEETLLSSGGTPTSIIDMGHELNPIAIKIPEAPEPPPITGVYTLPEEPEDETILKETA
ncbi:hypothetical protein FQA39_LY11683 [Lamprigera yunnana]|nr:hypothetical protein FQA39_LY11683 [Lamprigera yunnana]